MSVSVKLFEGEEVVGVIPSFQETETLESLRKLIVEEDVIEDEFVFLWCGKVSQFQEGVLKVEDIGGEIMMVGGKKVLRVEVGIGMGQVESESDGEYGGGQDMEQKSTERTTRDGEREEQKIKQPQELKRKATEVGGKVLAKEERSFAKAFHRQKPWELKQIKLYSEQQVVSSRGMRQEYFKFWNKRVKEFCLENPSYSKQRICAQINEQWRQKQQEILKTEADMKHNSKKPGTISNNMQRIEAANQELQALQNELGGAGLSQGKKERLLAEKQRLRSELKKAQETMRKNLKSGKSKKSA